jgi:hypothetical protein
MFLDTTESNDGFFNFSGHQGDEQAEKVPAEIFRHILSFLFAYPYYFTLERVCKQWHNEIQNIYVNYLFILLTNVATSSKSRHSEQIYCHKME